MGYILYKCSNWFKNESSLKRIKNEYRSTLKLFCAINGFKKHLIFEKKNNFLKIGKIGHNAWAIAVAKCSIWFKNESSIKRLKNDCKSTLESFCAKKVLQKTPDITKMTTF